MPHVKEYMSTPVITVTRNETIAGAIRLMNQHDTNGLIVVDEQNAKKVLGVISSLDILSYLVPDYLEEDKHLASFEPDELFVKRVHEISSHTVATCMTAQPLHSVTGDDTLMEAAALLTEYRIHRLPVVDNEDRLIGYLSRSDIKRAIQQILDTEH